MNSENPQTGEASSKDNFLNGLKNVKFTNAEESADSTPQDKREPAKGRRTFSWHQKEECWNRASVMIGRHPDRWRLDAVGNPVFKYLKGCNGPLCHEYDHIVPFSKGGKTVPENCQILQSSVNLFKSNKLDVTHEELMKSSPTYRFSKTELDGVEVAAYGNIKPSSLDDMVSHRKTLYTNTGSENNPSPPPRRPRGQPKTDTPVPEKVEPTPTPTPENKNN